MKAIALYIFINGIHAWPGDAEGWTDRAVSWTHLHTDARAEKFEYHANFATRRLKQQARAETFARMITHYLAAPGRPAGLPPVDGVTTLSPWEIHLVGHSNGADIILRILEQLFGARYPHQPLIRSVHLIAPACGEDFSENRLNEYLLANLVGNVFVHWGDEDRAMIAARVSKIALSAFGLGYGDMGLHGPSGVLRTVEKRVGNWLYPGHGHSTFFEPEEFDRTMRAVTNLSRRCVSSAAVANN